MWNKIMQNTKFVQIHEFDTDKQRKSRGIENAD